MTVLAVAALVLSGCGGGDDGEGAAAGGGTSGSASGTTSDTASSSPTDGSSSTATGSASDSGAADQVLHDAVDASLGASSFDVDASSRLTIGPGDSGETQELRLDASGPADFTSGVTDRTLELDDNGQKSSAHVISDGTTAWVSITGPQAPTFPDGKTWLSGPASLLTSSSTFGPEGTIGTVIVLRSAQDAEQVSTGEKDGVAATEYRFTVPYEDAVSAAGADADTFTNAFSLTGDATSADLDVDVWVGDDDNIVRELTMTVDADVPVTGGAEVELSHVGQPVDDPTPPDAADVASGPDAEALLQQLTQS